MNSNGLATLIRSKGNLLIKPSGYRLSLFSFYPVRNKMFSKRYLIKKSNKFKRVSCADPE
ncbi:hypothetical protein P278_08620 [Zhouia amylolytica AD3]|uniref:Uncharacterized protein n=1 Tax=Zhouia amylolytica AD3 TaxID=1286632 RepID=W2USA8_9FLAO|nr:hypothetical protein P278_08620 [Zhouia amylolytica AD3]